MWQFWKLKYKVKLLFKFKTATKVFVTVMAVCLETVVSDCVVRLASTLYCIIDNI